MKMGCWAYFSFMLLSMFLIGVQCQQKRRFSPSVVVALPPGVKITQSTTISVAVSENAEILAKAFDGSVLLEYKRVVASAGTPTNVNLGPFVSAPRSFLVRIDIKALSDGKNVYSHTLHLPRMADLADIHLETDKPVYRPMERVRFRILPLTTNYQITTTPLLVLIKNPDQLVVWQASFTASSDKPFIRGEFRLPRHLAEGRWMASVIDKTTDTLLSKRGFEVLQYELPKFEVLAVTSISYYASGKESVEAVVFARLATGRPVSGALSLTCSSSLASTGSEIVIQTMQIENGNATVRFNLQRCWSPSLDKPPSSITVRADVRDYDSAEKQSSTVELPWQEKPYTINIRPLKPGLITGRLNTNFTAPFLITVFQPNGHPASGVPIRATVQCIQQRNRIENSYTDEPVGVSNGNGQLLVRFNFKKECTTLMLKASTNDQRLSDERQSSTRLLFPGFIPDATFMLDLEKYHVKVGESMQIRLLTPIFSVGNPSIRILALSSLNVLAHFTVNGQMNMFPISSEMIPEFVLVLYHVNKDSPTVIIDDVVRISVSYECGPDMASLRLDQPNETMSNDSLFNPGSNATLVLEGSQGGFVATKAIDKKFEQLFRQLRIFSKVDTASAWKGDILERLFDSSETLAGLDFVALNNRTVTTCCSAGRVWWQVNVDCPYLPEPSVNYLENCRRAFISCCDRTELPKADPACQRGQSQCRNAIVVAGVGPRIKFHRDHDLSPAIIAVQEAMPKKEETIRRFFPEVWLFEEYGFSAGSSLVKPVSLPHSITNWTITGRFWAPGMPLCHVQSEIRIDASAYMDIDLPSIVYVGDQLLVKVIVYNFQSQEKRVSLIVSKPTGLCTTAKSSGPGQSIEVGRNSTSSIFVPLEFLRSGRYEIDFTLLEFVGHSRSQQMDKVIKEVHALDREIIDSSLEYNFSWDLASGDSIEKWMNDTIINYKFVRVRDDEVPEIRTSLYLTDAAMAGIRIEKVIAQFTPLPAAKRSRWSKFKLANDTWRNFATASTLNEVLIKAPSVLQAVEDNRDNDDSVPNKAFIQSSQMLHFCIMETLSFRAPNGAYSPYRIKDPEVQTTVPVSVWLTILTSTLHCRTAMDASVVCPPLRWLAEQQNSDGSFSSPDSADFTTLTNSTDNTVMLTSFTLLTMRACTSYGAQCWADERRNVSVVANAVRYLMKMDPKKTDPLVLGGLTLALAAWKLPARPHNDALLKLLEEGSDYPYWTYKPRLGGFFDRLKHGAKGWFSNEYRKKMLSCQITLNSMALLAQLSLNNPRRLNLEQIGLWLIEHRKRDGTFVRTLDTVIASRALDELQRSMIQRATNVFTRISVQCEDLECPSITITPQNSELTQIITLNLDDRGIKFLVTGNGAVYVKFQLVANAPVRNPNYYPVQLSANTSNISISQDVFFNKLCLKSSDESITSLMIEHNFATGLAYIPESFQKTKGNATAFPPEPTSHSVHVLYSDIRMNEEQCYTFQTRKKSQQQPIFSFRRPIVAKHSTMGIVGITLSGGQYQGSQGPFLEKYCPPNQGECICAEAACPPPRAECAISMCTDSHIKNLMKALCNANNTGCVLRVIGQEEETVGSTVYRRTKTSKHYSLSLNSTDDECKDLDLLTRKSCSCPQLRMNHFYLAVIRRDALLETTIAGVRPTVLIGEHGLFEPIFACSDKRQSDIQKLAQENYRQTICANIN